MKQINVLREAWSAFDKYLLRFFHSGVVLCVSGGGDSRCLLESLACWPNRFSKIIVVCVDHAVREDSYREAVFVCKRAAQLGFSSYLIRSLRWYGFNENVWRNQRYSSLFDLAREVKIPILVTAHTQNDQAENVLMGFIGSSGGSGSGMSVYTSCLIIGRFNNEGIIVRPLLGHSRNHILLILSELNVLDFFEDPSNVFGPSRRLISRTLLQEYDISLLSLSKLAMNRQLELLGMESASYLFIVRHTIKKLELDLKFCPIFFRLIALKNAFKLFCPGKNPRGIRDLLSVLLKDNKIQRGRATISFCIINILSESHIILEQIY